MPDAEKLELKSEINGSVVFKEAEKACVTSDAGIVMGAELLARTGVVEQLVERLTDPRDPRWVRHGVAFATALVAIDGGLGAFA